MPSGKSTAAHGRASSYKSGIAISMLAIPPSTHMGSRRSPACVCCGDDRRRDCSGTSRGVIEEEARRSSAVLVLEPSLPGGAAKTSRKGVGDFELVVHGVAAHAGLDPGKGASAIHELARQILNLEALQNPDRGITVNVGVIAGGSRSNVVAERATARVDVRVQTMADAARVESAIRALRAAHPAVRLEISGAVNRPPLERSPGVARLYERAARIAVALGRDLQEGAAGGGSDGNFTAALGVPTLDGLGPQGDGAQRCTRMLSSKTNLGARHFWRIAIPVTRCETPFSRRLYIWHGLRRPASRVLSGVMMATNRPWLGGANGLVLAFIIAAVMNLGSYWFSDKIVLRMYRAQQVGPEHPLYRIVERLTVRASLPMPKVYIIPDPSPNAFATGRNPSHAAVAATEGILKVLSEHELEGVIAHELAHVKHRDILISSVAATIAAAIIMTARMAHLAALFGGVGGRGDDRDRGNNPIALLAMRSGPLRVVYPDASRCASSRRMRRAETRVIPVLSDALLKIVRSKRYLEPTSPAHCSSAAVFRGRFTSLQRIPDEARIRAARRSVSAVWNRLH